MPTAAPQPCPQCRKLNCNHPRRTSRQDAVRTKRTRRAVVEAWKQQYGNWCPGWGTGPHHATDLTADHPIPIAAGGDSTQALGVLCRACNTRKGRAIIQPSG